MKTHRSLNTILIIGDIAAILVVTLAGFLEHYKTIQGWRWLSTFIPALIGWFVVAPWLGVYRPDVACEPRQVWRPALAGLLSAPLAATLRGFWLNTPILPVFVLVLGLTHALTFLVWRLLFAGVYRWNERKAASHG